MNEDKLELRVSMLVDNVDVDESELNELEQAVYSSLNNSKTYSDFQRNIKNIVSSARNVFEAFGASLPSAVNIDRLVKTLQDGLKGIKLDSGDILDEDVIDALSNRIKNVYNELTNTAKQLPAVIKTSSSEADKLVTILSQMRDSLNASINSIQQLPTVVDTTKQLPATIQTAASNTVSLENAIKQVGNSFTAVNDNAKQLPAVIETAAKTGASELQRYVDSTQKSLTDLMLRIDAAPNMAGIDKIQDKFTKLSETFLDITELIASKKLDVSSAFVGLDDINKEAETLKASFNNFNGVINTLKRNHEQYNNSVQQSLAKQIQSEEELKKVKEQQANYSSAAYDKAIQKEEERKNFANKSARESAQVFIQAEKEKENAIKESANSFKNQGNEFNKAFSFAKVTVGLTKLINLLKSCANFIDKNIRLAANFGKNVAKGFVTATSAVLKFTATLSGMSIILKGIQKVASDVKSVLSTAFSGINLSSILKESSNLASSLTEVQNIINHVFAGEGRQVIEDFASTAVEKLGMSTLAAKQFAGKFGAALTTTGQSRDSVVAMSKALTQLTSDIASFYDIEQDIAASKLFSGVISGQIKPMRELGVDMTIASLSAYAAAQGYETEYRAMSAAEKQAVRFKYAMDKLSFAHGDYLRTINSTANQFRLLKNQIKELGSMLGSIINVFLNPLLHVLNSVASRAIQATQALMAMLGIRMNFSTGGGAGLTELNENLDDTSDSADDLAESEDNAVDSLRKLNKAAKGALSPLHKLNVLQGKNAQDSSDSGALSGLQGLAISASQDLPTIKDLISNFLNWLQSFDLDKYLDDILSKLEEFFHALPDKIQAFFDMLQNWVALFAEVFNKVVDKLKGALGYDIGKSISEFFEGIFRSLNTWLEQVEHFDVGQALANIANGIIDNVELFKQAFSLVGNIIEAGFESLLGFALEFHWDTLGENLEKGLAKGISKLNPDVIYNAILETLNGITDTITTFCDNLHNDEDTQTKIGEALRAVLDAGADYVLDGGFSKLLNSLSSVITDALNGLEGMVNNDKNQKAFAQAVTDIIEAAGPIASQLVEIGETIANKYIIPALTQFFTDKDIPLPLKISAAVSLANITGLDSVISSIAGVVAHLWALGSLKGKIQEVSDTIKGLKDSSSNAEEGVKGVTKGSENAVIVMAALIASLQLINSVSQEINGEPFIRFSDIISDTLLRVSQIIIAIGTFKELVKQSLSTASWTVFAEIIEGIGGAIHKLGDALQGIPLIGDKYAEDISKVGIAFEETADKMKTSAASATTETYNTYNKTIDGMHQVDDAYMEGNIGIIQALKETWTAFDGEVDTSTNDLVAKTKTGLSEVETAATTASTNISKGFGGMPSEVEAKMREMNEKSSAQLQGITDKSRATSDELKEQLSTNSTEVNAYLQKAAEDTRTWLDGLLTDSTEKTKQSTEQQKEAIKGIGTSTEEVSFEGLDTKFKEASDGVVTSADDLTTRIQESITGLFGEDTTIWGDILTSFNSGVTEPLMTEGIDPLLEQMKEKFQSLSTETEDGSIWGDMISSFNTAVAEPLLSEGIEPLTTSITEKFTEMLESLKGEELWGGFSGWMTDSVWTPITESLDELKTKIEEVFVEGLEDIKTGWEDLATSVTDAIQTMIDGLNDAADAARSLAEELANAASAASSASSSSSYRGYPSSVQGYANGGVFRPNTPQLAILGDNKSQTEYALTTGHLREIASMMASAIDTGSNGGVETVTANIYLGTELIDQEIINVGNMHNYRSNGR